MPYDSQVAIATDPAVAGVVRREPFRQRGRTTLLVVFAILGAVGVVGGIVLAVLGAGDVAGAGMSFVFALIPLPLLWVSYWWLDRYEPEPRRYKLAAFVWGGVVAVAIALVLQIWIQSAYDVSDDTMASVVAPLTEEPAKCLFLLLTFMRARRVIDGFLDGLIFAGLVGIGFAFVENIGYYAASYLGSDDIKIDGPAGVTTTFIVRGVFSPFAHPLFTSAFGIAIGLAVTRKSKFAKVGIVLLGLALSIGLHAMWNASLSFGGGAGFLLVYLALAVVLLIVAVVRDRREVQADPRTGALALVRRAARLDPPGGDPLPVTIHVSQGCASICQGSPRQGRAQGCEALSAARNRDGVPA